jgi:DtxR family Mn-dependent transcriptional regulator
VTKSGTYVLVRVEGHDEGLELPTEVAQHIYVTA